MEKKIKFHNSNGQTLVGILTESKRNDLILVMAHGFSSNKNTINFVRLAESLDKEGIPSLRFDFFGHGESDGLFENITITEAVDDILQAISYVKSLGYQKVGLLGSSFGGISSIMAASKTDALKFVALKSPVSDFWAVEKGIHSKEELDEWKKKKVSVYDQSHMLNYSFVEDFDNHDAYEAARKIAVPTLIVHGSKDAVVPHSQSEKLATCLPNAELVTIPGADHSYTNEIHAQQMRDAFLNFIVNHSR